MEFVLLILSLMFFLAGTWMVFDLRKMKRDLEREIWAIEVPIGLIILVYINCAITLFFAVNIPEALV